MTASPNVAISSYQLRLEGFEGPLDVLLQLIERQQLDISNLSLIAVTDGFLAYIDQMSNPPPRLLGEFIGIAARLLVLKSRSLLPRTPVTEPEDDVDDLAARLREYQKVKRLAAGMLDSQQSGWRSFGQQSGAPDQQINVILETPDPGVLMRLFLRAIARQPTVPDIAPIRPAITVADMARRLLSHGIRHGRRFRFFEVVSPSNRPETVAGFVALLSLWARGELHISQNELFGDIECHATTMSE
ncbi:ScpA family protein [soil metagenome]